MVKIVLSDQSPKKSPNESEQTPSLISTYIKRWSFGFVQTEKQVMVVQAAIIAIGFIWFLITLMTFGEDEVTTIELKPELLNAEQPIGSL